MAEMVGASVMAGDLAIAEIVGPSLIAGDRATAEIVGPSLSAGDGATAEIVGASFEAGDACEAGDASTFDPGGAVFGFFAGAAETIGTVSQTGRNGFSPSGFAGAAPFDRGESALMLLPARVASFQI
jgi:hypothetical protein